MRDPSGSDPSRYYREGQPRPSGSFQTLNHPVPWYLEPLPPGVVELNYDPLREAERVAMWAHTAPGLGPGTIVHGVTSIKAQPGDIRGQARAETIDRAAKIVLKAVGRTYPEIARVVVRPLTETHPEFAEIAEEHRLPDTWSAVEHLAGLDARKTVSAVRAALEDKKGLSRGQRKELRSALGVLGRDGGSRMQVLEQECTTTGPYDVWLPAGGSAAEPAGQHDPPAAPEPIFDRPLDPREATRPNLGRDF